MDNDDVALTFTIDDIALMFTMEIDRCRRFANSDKLSVVRHVEKRLGEGGSIDEACRELNIDTKQCRSWKKLRTTLAERNPLARSVDQGRSSISDQHDQQLLRFVFENREQGVEVSVKMVAIQARALSREFREKTPNAQIKCTSRFVEKHDLMHRLGTKMSQRSPESMENEALDFMTKTRPLVHQPNRHEDFVMTRIRVVERVGS